MRRTWLALVLVAAGVACGPASTVPPGSEDEARSSDPPVVLPSPDEELADLRGLLDPAAETFGEARLFAAPNPLSVLSARLACFERRFGVDPRTLPRWAGLEAEANRLLEVLAGRGCPETAEVQDVSAQMDRLVLLDIVGRQEEVDELLASVRTAGADGCPYCTADNGALVNQRRSEQAERRGDQASALSAQVEAALDTQANSSAPLGAPGRKEAIAGEAWLYLRLAFLLVDTGRSEEGRWLLGALARCFPDDPAAAFARQELATRAWTADADASRVLGALSILAVWNDRERGSLRWIGARASEPGGVSPGHLRMAAFEAERGRLVEALAEPFAAASALRLLDALEGGAGPHVSRYLEHAARSAEPRPAGPRLAEGDAVLRWLYDGGPDPKAFRDGAAGFARAWRDWIDRRD